MSKEHAICMLNFNEPRKGLIYFYSIGQNLTNMVILLRHIGLEYGNLKGLHLHECGDLTDGCNSACAHYNPNGTTHGGLIADIRHYGDFGNIVIDKEGNCLSHITNVPISIEKCVGRSIVLHQAEDDLGLGDVRYINTPNKINRILLNHPEYSNKKICSLIMGKHKLLSKELEDLIKNDLIELRKEAPRKIEYSKINKNNTKSYIDNVINRLIPVIKDFVDSKIAESKKTGNSGARIACGVVGYCNKKSIEELVKIVGY